MGLSVEVGILAALKLEDLESYGFYLDQFVAVNEVLRRAGLPEHREPGDLGEAEPFSMEMFGYSGLHCLRRIAAHLEAGKPLPEPGDESAAEDPVSAAYYDAADDEQAPPRAYDNLMLHSDAEGYYLPQPLTRVLFTEEEDGVAGNIIGSSIGLRAECVAVARALKLPLTLAPDAPEVWEATDPLKSRGQLWQRYAIESICCLALFHACERSMALGAAVVFV